MAENPTMTRRTAFTTVAVLAAAQTFPISQSYTPYASGSQGPGTEHRVVDLASVREVWVRLPQGSVVIKTEDIWKALTATK